MNSRPFACTVSLVLLFLATGCATKTISAFDEKKLAAIDTVSLAQEYALLRKGYSTEKAHGRTYMEIQNDRVYIPSDFALSQIEIVLLDKGFTKEELAIAKQGKIYIGMRVICLYASRGAPLRENRSVSASGESIQHVYGTLGPFVYSKDGIVTSWQD